MSNPRIASRYAKSLVDLSIEQQQLESVYADMQYYTAACKANRDFVNLLQSPIVHADKKNAIIEEVGQLGNVSALTQSFTRLLVNKGREADLQLIAEAVVDQYNEIKGIHKVKLTTAVAVSDSIKETIKQQVQAAKNAGTIELETVIDESLIGGFVLEFDGKLVDLSILRDLKDIKKQFSNNDYVSKLY